MIAINSVFSVRGWSWLVCPVCVSREDFNSLLHLTCSHPNKRQEECNKDALPATFFFQSQIADLRGFSPGARNRRRATGTWPSPTWHLPGKAAWPSVPSSTDSSLSSCAYQSRPAVLASYLCAFAKYFSSPEDCTLSGTTRIGLSRAC